MLNGQAFCAGAAPSVCEGRLSATSRPFGIEGMAEPFASLPFMVGASPFEALSACSPPNLALSPELREGSVYDEMECP